MKKDVVISIKGVYSQYGDKDVVELFTTGQFYKKNNSYYIMYDESEATGFEGMKTTLKIDSQDKVTMLRTGSERSQLIIEKGVRHQCHYNTGNGSLMIGVSGDRVISSLNEMGGNVEFKYSLDINTMLTSENEVYVNVRGV